MKAQDQAESVSYAELSLVDLTRRIVALGDHAALAELHDRRPVFRLATGAPHLLAEFLDVLCRHDRFLRIVGGDAAKIEWARDYTLDRFALLAGPESAAAREHSGPDCRRYFRAFLDAYDRRVETHPPRDAIDAESMATAMLQMSVMRHFQFSCLEAIRRLGNPTRSRYAWKLGEKTLSVWMPKRMSGAKRRNWLEKNVPDVLPSRPGETDRVQQLIDERLGNPDVYSLDTRPSRLTPDPRANDPFERASANEDSGFALSDIVAAEKAERVEEQRPAIRALGAARLAELVRQIIEALVNERYNERELAVAFGLSRATFSRFAGSRWRRSAGVPDLWANVAETVVRHPPFAAAAERAGVWERVCRAREE